MTITLPQRADTVIIGGGIMGVSIARQLARRQLGTTVVLERDLIAAGASGRTGALLRQHYTNIPEATLAARSLEIFRNWNDHVGGDCGFVETGLVVTMPTLAGYEDNIPRMERTVEQLRSLGVAIELVDAAQLAELEPAGKFDDIGIATFEPRSGYVDAIAATRSMAEAAVEAGAVVVEGVTATAIESTDSRVTGVNTSLGSIATERVILATGPWSVPIAASVGVKLPIEAQRVQVAIFQLPATVPVPVRTYVDNVAAIFGRPWGPGRYMIGLGGGELHDIVDPDRFDSGNDAPFADLARHAASSRFPVFEQAKVLHGHAGLYDMTTDGHPIIGPAGPDGLWIVAGFSGAGFKKGPAIGEALAGVIEGDLIEQALLAPFALDRDWQAPWSANEYRLAHDFGHGF